MLVDLSAHIIRLYVELPSVLGNECSIVILSGGAALAAPLGRLDRDVVRVAAQLLIILRRFELPLCSVELQLIGLGLAFINFAEACRRPHLDRLKDGTDVRLVLN